MGRDLVKEWHSLSVQQQMWVRKKAVLEQKTLTEILQSYDLPTDDQLNRDGTWKEHARRK